MFRHWKLFVIVILVGINCFLFLTLQGKRTHFNQAFHDLSQSPTAWYFEEQNPGNGLGYLFYDWSTRHAGGDGLRDASDSLTKAIDEIRKRYVERDSVAMASLSAADYFSGRISVDPKLEKALLHAYERYQAEMVHILQRDIAKLRSFRDSLAVVMQRELNKVETQLMASPVGTFQTRTLYAPVRPGTDNAFAFIFRGIRQGDSIRWEKERFTPLGHDDYVNLGIQFRQTARSPRLLRISNGLNKMSSVLGDPAKVEMYGKVYSLSSVTLGELDSITKYMLLLHWKTNRDLIDLANELTTINAQ